MNSHSRIVWRFRPETKDATENEVLYENSDDEDYAAERFHADDDNGFDDDENASVTSYNTGDEERLNSTFMGLIERNKSHYMTMIDNSQVLLYDIQSDNAENIKKTLGYPIGSQINYKSLHPGVCFFVGDLQTIDELSNKFGVDVKGCESALSSPTVQREFGRLVGMAHDSEEIDIEREMGLLVNSIASALDLSLKTEARRKRKYCVGGLLFDEKVACIGTSDESFVSWNSEMEEWDLILQSECKTAIAWRLGTCWYHGSSLFNPSLFSYLQ